MIEMHKHTQTIYSKLFLASSEVVTGKNKVTYFVEKQLLINYSLRNIITLGRGIFVSKL